VIPVNLWGALVYAIGAYLSDRYQTRFFPIILMAPLGVAGYAILLSPVSPGVQYFATYLISTACFICTGGNITWLSANCAPDGKRAASLGILLTLTNIGGVVSGQIYQSNAAPKYILGHAWSLGCLAFAWCGWWIVRAMYKRREQRKDKKIAAGYIKPDGVMYTDREPDFRYQI
jgi:MFS family permease